MAERATERQRRVEAGVRRRAGEAPRALELQAASERVEPAHGGGDAPGEENATTLSGQAARERMARANRMAAAEMLLALDDKTRAVASDVDLRHLMVNETRELTGARQIFFLKRNSRDVFQVRAISSIGVIDRDAPLVRWVESTVRQLGGRGQCGTQCRFTSSDVETDADVEEEYPFRQFLWQPLCGRDGAQFGGLLHASESAFEDPALALSDRQAGVYGHAWTALGTGRGVATRGPLLRWLWAAAGVSLVAIAFTPVSLTALAPAEVVARDPFIVAAPIDGVVDEIVAPANTLVKKGDLLVRFDDTIFRNRFAIADREMRVAEARYRRAVLGAFAEEQARHELAIAKAELALKRADRAFAKELLAKTRLTAPQAGLLIYGNAERWKGRPVQPGERIMTIAEQSRTELRIELPVDDAIVINERARVRVFLDTDPLNAIEAEVTSAAYQAETVGNDVLAFSVRARWSGPSGQYRIGARGTAQIHGDRVPLIFYLFRRPIAAVRQFFGL